MAAWNDEGRAFLESYATVYIASIKYTRQRFRPSYIVPSVVYCRNIILEFDTVILLDLRTTTKTKATRKATINVTPVVVR